MYPIGVKAWIWVSPPTNESTAELAPKFKAMGFDLFELGWKTPVTGIRSGWLKSSRQTT